MVDTININDAADLINEAEHAALKTIKSLIEQLFADLAAVEETLPKALPMGAARVIADTRANLSYVRTSTLPEALNRYEPSASQMLAPVSYSGTEGGNGQ
jgi:hypothetical protein